MTALEWDRGVYAGIPWISGTTTRTRGRVFSEGEQGPEGGYTYDDNYQGT